MKKTIGIFLVAVLVVLGGTFIVSAEDNAAEEQKIFKINIDNICTLLIAGEKPDFSVELDPEALDKIDVVSEKWIGPNELTVGGENIAVEGGKYNYELKLSAKEGFVFDNDLVVSYQGVDGKYNLHYDFPPGEDTNHTMIVTGDFDNIIAASPLIDKIDIGKLLTLVISEDYAQAVDFILDDGVSLADKASVDSDSSKINHVSDDKYSYELVLKTKEGFSFNNTLQFLYDEDKYGYSLDYNYDLSADKNTLVIKGIAEKKQDDTVKYNKNTYKVTSVKSKTVAFTKAKNAEKVAVPATIRIKGRTYKVTAVNAKAFRAKKIRSVTIGKNVKRIRAKAFYGSKVKTVTLKTKLLKKSKVKDSLKGSKVKTVRVRITKKKASKINRTYVKKYKKYFTKKNAGRKVTVG